jgi:hypothetical protein
VAEVRGTILIADLSGTPIVLQGNFVPPQQADSGLMGWRWGKRHGSACRIPEFRQPSLNVSRFMLCGRRVQAVSYGSSREMDAQCHQINRTDQAAMPTVNFPGKAVRSLPKASMQIPAARSKIIAGTIHS